MNSSQAENDPFTERTSCPCCLECKMDPRTGKCKYGGPFTGYSESDDYNEWPMWAEFSRAIGDLPINCKPSCEPAAEEPLPDRIPLPEIIIQED